MSSKKSTGLSKKIPAIFQGIPDINSGPSQSPLGPGLPSSLFSRSRKPAANPLRIVFEVGEASFKMGILARKDSHLWEPLQTFKKYFEPSSDGKFKRDFVALGTTLKEWIEKFPGIPFHECRLLLTGKGIFVGEEEKPAGPRKTIRDSLVFQLAEKCPFPVEESTLLFEAKEKTVSVVAVQNSLKDTVLSLFHEKGIYLHLVTTLPVVYESIRPYGLPDSNFLLMDLGRSQTSMILFRKGEFYAMRDVVGGGEQITRAMMGTFVVEDSQIVISYEEAARLKETLGLPTADLLANDGEVKLSQLAARIRPIFEKLVSELRSSLFVFQKQFPTEKIETLVLTGGGAQLKGIESFLTKQLNMPVQLLNTEKIHPQLDLSLVPLIGLGCANEKRFNFAAVEDRWKPKLEGVRNFLKVGSFMSLVLLTLGGAWFGWKLGNAQKELHHQEMQYQGLTAEAQKMEELNALLKAIAERREWLRMQIGSSGPNVESVLLELSHLTAPAVILKKLIYQTQTAPSMNFEGWVQEGPRSPDLMLAEFLEAINASPFFYGSILESRDSQSPSGKAVEFLIRTQLVAPLEG